jgi:hypothetical protein
MKKILLSRITTYIVAMACISGTNAQQSNTAFAVDLRPLITSKTFTPNPGLDPLAATPLSEINVKVVRHFSKSFKLAENVHWFTVSDGLMAYFTENGIKTRSGYDKKGNWLYNLRTYTEEYLPREVRTQVKTVFYDFSISCVKEFSISCVKEITNARQIIYVVLIEDKNSFKNIRVCDEEMEVAEELIK